MPKQFENHMVEILCHAFMCVIDNKNVNVQTSLQTMRCIICYNSLL
jgi:hypothetical protein